MIHKSYVLTNPTVTIVAKIAATRNPVTSFCVSALARPEVKDCSTVTRAPVELVLCFSSQLPFLSHQTAQSARVPATTATTISPMMAYTITPASSLE